MPHVTPLAGHALVGRDCIDGSFLPRLRRDSGARYGSWASPAEGGFRIGTSAVAIRTSAAYVPVEALGK